jgi:hypothetical protein
MAPISGIDPEMQGEMMTLPQCKCKDIERCSQEMSKFAEKCKVECVRHFSGF